MGECNMNEITPKILFTTFIGGEISGVGSLTLRDIEQRVQAERAILADSIPMSDVAIALDIFVYIAEELRKGRIG